MTKISKTKHVTKHGIVKRNPIKKRGTFPNNLIKFKSKEKEIARSILNNGIFTIAHNWSEDDRDDFTHLFKKLGASRDLLFELDVMFNELSRYEYPAPYGDSSSDDYMDSEQVKESAWEEMAHSSNKIDRLMKDEGIISKMQKKINW